MKRTLKTPVLETFGPNERKGVRTLFWGVELGEDA
jgi:hypothetical protein